MVVSFILTIVAFALSGVFAYLFVLKGVDFDPAYSDVLFNLNDTVKLLFLSRFLVLTRRVFPR
jgi:hypothetical protein